MYPDCSHEGIQLHGKIFWREDSTSLEIMESTNGEFKQLEFQSGCHRELSYSMNFFGCNFVVTAREGN